MQRLTEEQYQQHLHELDTDGYTVIKGAVSAQLASDYASRLWDQWEAVNAKGKISRNDPSTWYGDEWPSNIHGIIKNYAVGHWQVVWDARTTPMILDFYERFFGTKDLRVSYDGAVIIRPSTTGSRSAWAHVDQGAVLTVQENNGPKRKVRDFVCIQGVLNLLENGPLDGGFTCYKGSHKGHADFFESKGQMTNEEREKCGLLTASEKRKKKELKEKAEKENKTLAELGESYYSASESAHWRDYKDNWYKFDLENDTDKAFVDKYPRVKVCAGPGDFIVWNSRCIHYAEAIDRKLNPDPKALRMGIYVSMLPAKYETDRDNKRRAEYLRDLRTTSHWAAINLSLNGLNPRTYGDEKRLTNFTTPCTPPVLTARMKQLAGVPQDFSFAKPEKTLKRTATKQKTKKEPAKKSKLWPVMKNKN